MNKKEFDTIAEVIRDRKENGTHLHNFGWRRREVGAAKAAIDDLQVFMAAKLRATYPKTFHNHKWLGGEVVVSYDGEIIYITNGGLKANHTTAGRILDAIKTGYIQDKAYLED